MPAETPLTRPQQAAYRRVEKWMNPSGWEDTPGFDHPAYLRMADELIGTMTAVGPAHSQAGLAALTKTIALIGHQMLLGTDEANVREFSDAVGKMIAAEILGLRLELLPRRLRRA